MARQSLSALKRESEIELAVKGRVSGRIIPRPVWFVLSKDEKALCLIPVDGRETQWYLNVKKEPIVKVRAGRASFTGKAAELPAERFREVLDAFRAKYGKEDIRRYYPRVGVDDVALEVSLTPSE